MERNDQHAEKPRSELEKRRHFFDVFWTIMAETYEVRARAEQRRLDGLYSVDASSSTKTEWIIDGLEGLASAYAEAANAWKGVAAGGVLDMTAEEARELAEDFEGDAALARQYAGDTRTMATTAKESGQGNAEAYAEAAEARKEEAAGWEKAQSFLTAYADVEAAGSWDQVD